MAKVSRREAQRRRFRAARNLLGLTQLDAATASGIGMYRYWRIEAGVELGTTAERARIAAVLRMTEAELWDGVPRRGPAVEHDGDHAQ